VGEVEDAMTDMLERLAVVEAGKAETEIMQVYPLETYLVPVYQVKEITEEKQQEQLGPVEEVGAVPAV